MLNPLNLIRSKRYVDEIEKDVNTMTPTNWKTNTIGIITGLMALAMIWAPTQYQPKIAATATALTSMGLLAAKDHDK